jgi:hypothetical protein
LILTPTAPFRSAARAMALITRGSLSGESAGAWQETISPPRKDSILLFMI